MEAVPTGMVGSKSELWHERFKLVAAAIALGFYFQNDPSREGHGWWCNPFQGVNATGTSVERYAGAKAVLDAAAKEGQHEVAS